MNLPMMAQILSLLLLPLARAAKGFNVDVGDRHVWSVVPRGFASMTMDFHPGSQGPTWGANASILEVDLSSAALRGYASALAPGVLRLGGSEAGSEVMYTDFPDDELKCPPGYYYCLSRARWDEILEFAAATGVRLMLDLNLIGPGSSTDFDGAGLSNIGAMLSYTAQQDAAAVWGWEVGNENQGTLEAAEAARRLVAVRGLIDEYWPDAAARPLLVGPSAHIETDWLMDFVAALGPTPTAVLDVFAYHMYSGYGLAGNLADQMMGPAFLDDAKALVRRAADAVHKVAPTMRVMVSETAAAWNSGAPNITDSFESGFWCVCCYRLSPLR